MSLIEEALRRIEETAPRRVLGSTQAPPAPPLAQPLTLPILVSPPVVTLPPSPSSFTVTAWIGFAMVGLTSVLLLGLGLMVGRWTQRHAVPATQAAVPTAGAESVMPLVAPTVPITAMTKPIKPSASEPTGPALELNGIVEGVGASFVLINGQIVRVGETIEDATLLEVRDGTVRLRWMDQEIVLKTPR